MLISDEYRAMNAKQHFERPEWGRQSMKWWEQIKGLCEHVKTKTFLDYGCGKQSLRDALAPFGYEVVGYDPAFPELSAPAQPHGLVVCTDVLEHVEPECLDAVLADLRRVTEKIAFLVVATRASIRTLPDGTNPHKIVETYDWWMGKLGEHFKVLQDLGHDDKYFGVLVGPK